METNFFGHSVAPLMDGNYYVIDNFPYPCFLISEEGIPISFKTYSEALAEAAL